jgi:hypothetical protein
MHVPEQKLASFSGRRAARNQRDEILATWMCPLAQPRPALPLADELKQIRHPIFAVRRIAERAPHWINAGCLNQLLQRFNGIKRHGRRL